MALCSVEKAFMLHLTSFLLSVLLQTIATSQSACGNFDSYCKNGSGTSTDPNLQLPGNSGEKSHSVDSTEIPIYLFFLFTSRVGKRLVQMAA